MLGTGNATVTRCYNTCFAIRHGERTLLVDAGGGNGILVQLEKAGIPLECIHDMFVTHAHTDHVLGVVWIVRMVAQRMQQGIYVGELHIYTHEKAAEVIEWICRNTLPGKIAARLGKDIFLHVLEDRERFEALGVRCQCFDIFSTKEKQYGFQMTLPDGQRLVCMGDEPYNERDADCVEGADWLLCEAFCLYEDRERFKPYEKHHSTALDAGQLADKLGVKRLLLYHTEDKTLPTRKERYAAEAGRYFCGEVYVPDDLETLVLL